MFQTTNQVVVSVRSMWLTTGWSQRACRFYTEFEGSTHFTIGPSARPAGGHSYPDLFDSIFSTWGWNIKSIKNIKKIHNAENKLRITNIIHIHTSLNYIFIHVHTV